MSSSSSLADYRSALTAPGAGLPALAPAGRLRDAAFNYEAISLEVFFILGPSMAALLVLAPWPGIGTALALTAMVVGTVAFALTDAVRAHRPAPGAHTGGAFGALAVP